MDKPVIARSMVALELQLASMAHLEVASGKKSALQMNAFPAQLRDVLMHIEPAIVAGMIMVFVCHLTVPKGF